MDSGSDGPEGDTIWESAESAKQIQRLGQVEQDIVKLMELASESMSLLALPQTDTSEETASMPKNRSAAFATNAEEYFRTLNSIQTGIRTSIAKIRAARIPPAALRAPEPSRGPSRMALGTGMPSGDLPDNPAGSYNDAGFQEKKVEAEAWAGVATALRQVVHVASSSDSKEEV